MFTFLNAWNLLNVMRTVSTGFDLQHTLAAFNKLGFGVNMLGAKAALWTFMLIPHQSKHPPRKRNFSTSYARTKLLCYLAGSPYKHDHELPVSHGPSDKTNSYKYFLKKLSECSLQLLAELHCHSYLQWNEQELNNMDIYDEFYQNGV